MTNHRPIMIPGVIPARNRSIIEMFAVTPKMMKAIEGGMIGAITPPAATSPAERGTS